MNSLLFNFGPEAICTCVRGAKIARCRNFENAKFCFHIASPALFRDFSGPAGGRSLRARVHETWCEALSSDENFGLAKGSISGGCRANLFFGTSIEHFEYQLTILSDGAGHSDAVVLELHFRQGNS